MWKEFLEGVGVLSLITLFFGIQSRKINGKMDTNVCKQRCKNTDQSFDSIKDQQKICQEQFKTIGQKLEEQAYILVEVKTILKVAAKKNGWE